MRKILFNDRYGLTESVLDGTKTMTRRAVGNRMTNYDITAYLKGYKDVAYNLAPYKIGEVVAVAQSYKDLGYTKEWVEQHISPNPNAKWTDPFEKKYPGWTNKMFVCADFMPNQIHILDIKLERLQDISDEDCLKEGITYIAGGGYGVKFGGNYNVFALNSLVAFAALIDKVSGKGTWESNPYVFAYEFELVK